MSPTMMPDFCATEPLSTPMIKMPARFGCSAVAATARPPTPRSCLSDVAAAGDVAVAADIGAAADVAVALSLAAGSAPAVYWSTLARNPAISAFESPPLYSGPDLAINLKCQIAGLPGTYSAAS